MKAGFSNNVSGVPGSGCGSTATGRCAFFGSGGCDLMMGICVTATRRATLGGPNDGGSISTGITRGITSD